VNTYSENRKSTALNAINDLKKVVYIKDLLQVISDTYTSTNPNAMMIKVPHTGITYATMNSSRWSDNIACTANFQLTQACPIHKK
jgi:hypothetical protein